MNLVIDQGNTFFKVALLKDNEIVSKETFFYSKIELFHNWINKNKKNKLSVIISSVVNQKIDLSKYNLTKTIYLNHKTKLPIINKYKTPKTLGNDRIANVVAAWKINPNKNSLVIDLGTCIKYDLINNKGEYLGGNISSGLNMRYKALNHYTDQLPLLTPGAVKFKQGNNTETSIMCGVQLGILHEIKGFIDSYTTDFGQLTIFMTGGDAKYFDKSIKNDIFANSNLTLIGLNEILEHNA